MVLRNGVERWQTPEPQSPSADRAVPTDLAEEYLQAVRRLDQGVERDRLAMLAAHAYGTAFPTSRDRGTLGDMDEPRSGSGPEDHDPDLLHEADLLREVEQRTLIGQAAAVLLEGYGLTPAQAATFLAEKAAEDDRDVADVALEIVRDQPTAQEP